nr:MAG: ORF1 [Torque teno virus]
MVWRRGRRWRRWRWRRKPRWRRWRRWRRRRRRPARRRRPRRVRRRRGGWRRSYRRWKRRRGRRRHKKKLILTQWQPAVVKKCRIVGYDPIIICGLNRTSHNSTTHAEDYTTGNQAFGGGLCTTKYTLRILFQEYMAHHNYWTASNRDLELARYLGASIIFFKHPTVDFVARVRTMPPFNDTDMTAASLHPGMLMLAKKKIIIPSLKTRPSRKHYVKIKIGAPKLFEDKWYSQRDLCDTTLVVIEATVADLQYPFGSPLTNSICCNFQVLNSNYDNALSTLIGTQGDKDRDQCYKFLLNTITYYNTSQTLAQLNKFLPTTNTTQLSDSNAANSINPSNKTENTYESTNKEIHNNTLYGGAAYYKQNGTSTTTLPPHKMKEANKAYTAAAQKILGNWNFTSMNTSSYSDLQNLNYFDYYTGMFSSIFLASGRSNWEVKGSYTDITYNPLVDKGEGNMIWIDWITKGDTIYSETKSKCLLRDLPMWALCYGYADYVLKCTGISSIKNEARIVMRCPYTYPQLVKHSNDNFGFVVYSDNFGRGRMPGGDPVPSTRNRVHWYITITHQTEVLECISQTGPFAYHSDERKVVLTIKYNFRWKWGGNPVFQQILRDPCSGSSGSGPRRVPRSIQVDDPKYQTPEYIWHAWDFRRGLFSQKGIKRVSEQPTDVDLPTGRGKRPKRDTDGPQEQGQEEGSSSIRRVLQQWLHSSQEQSQESEEETAPTTLSQELQKQLKQQQLMGKQLRELSLQLAQVQAGGHLHPLLQCHA